MFLPASASLPLLTPPFASILSTNYPFNPANTHDQFSHNQNSHRRSNPHQSPHSALRNPNSLHNLLLDESAITSRKAAISTYGYSWLRPAGVAKTMLGRREEEAEREELERQMREQEEMEMEMERGEELARQARMREQQQQQGGEDAQGEEVEQRDLDDAIPEADEHENEEEEAEADLDEEIPDADNTFGDEEEEDHDGEGETGITDDVEHTSLGENDISPRPVTATMVPPGNRGVQNPNIRQVRGQEAQAARQTLLHRRQQEQAEQQALADEMLDEDEQAYADRDLDGEMPNADEDEMEPRDLDDDVPEADEEMGEEGEWQHTDTELEEDESAMILMGDEGDVSMDMSVVDGRRSVTAARSILATPATEGSSMLHTPATGVVGSGGRRWLSRHSLSGRGRTGNLFAGIMGRGSGTGSGSPQAPTQVQPQIEANHAQQQEHGGQQQQQQRQPSRRSGRRGFGRENQSARESLD